MTTNSPRQPVDPIEPDRLVIESLLTAQEVLRDFSSTFGRGDYLADLAAAQRVAAAAKTLESATWLSLQGNVTYEDLGKHLGISRQAVSQHMSSAKRRIEAGSPSELSADQSAVTSSSGSSGQSLPVGSGQRPDALEL